MYGAIRRSVRKLLLPALERTGLLWVSPRHAFGKGDQQRFVILGYHRVSQLQQDDFLPSRLTCPASRFREHLTVLRRHFSILPLEEAWVRVREGDALPPRTVVLTFDDCWAENMKTVAEPLAEAKVPATFFISAGDIDREDLHPNHRFYYLVSRMAFEQLRQAFRCLLPAGLSLQKANSGTFRRRVESCLGYSLTSNAGHDFLESLEQTLGASSSRGLGKLLYLTSAQVRSLPRYGIRVGNHTLNHPQLRSLDEEEQLTELEEAQRILLNLTNQPIRTLAYPYGLPEYFDATSAKLAAKLGHICACSMIRGYNDVYTDPMVLRRIDVTRLSGQELAFHLLWRKAA